MIDFSKLIVLDYFVIAVVGLSTLFAIFRGFIGSFLSLIGWVASIYLTYLTYPHISALVEAKLHNKILALIFGHASLLIGYLIVFGIFNTIASKVLTPLTKGALDKLLGALFGVLRGYIIVSFIFFALNSALIAFRGSSSLSEISNNDMPNWMKEAQSLPHLLEGQAMIIQFIPEDFMERIQGMVDTVSNTSTQDRFVDSAIEKLEKSTPSTTRQSIEKSIADMSINNSQEQLESTKLKELYENYRKSSPVDKAKSGLTQDDIRKIQDYLKNAPQASEPKSVDIIELEDHLTSGTP